MKGRVKERKDENYHSEIKAKVIGSLHNETWLNCLDTRIYEHRKLKKKTKLLTENINVKTCQMEIHKSKSDVIELTTMLRFKFTLVSMHFVPIPQAVV